MYIHISIGLPKPCSLDLWPTMHFQKRGNFGIFFVKELLQTLLKIFYILADSDASDKIHKCYHDISKDLFQIFVLIFLDFFSI